MGGRYPLGRGIAARLAPGAPAGWPDVRDSSPPMRPPDSAVPPLPPTPSERPLDLFPSFKPREPRVGRRWRILSVCITF
jgi:hypothetical protein